MESFCIAVAKALNLPGFGDNAIADNDGNTYPLNTAEDYYLRVAANTAFMGETGPEAKEADIRLSGGSHHACHAAGAESRGNQPCCLSLQPRRPFCAV